MPKYSESRERNSNIDAVQIIATEPLTRFSVADPDFAMNAPVCLIVNQGLVFLEIFNKSSIDLNYINSCYGALEECVLTSGFLISCCN